MPDVFALAGIPALTRLRTPELAVAVADDGADAKGAAVARLTTLQQNLGITLSVIEAVDGRIKLRRPLPPPQNIESLQSLVRRGRRRLERERQGATRSLHDVRLDAVTKLRAVLET
jgi:hypothetical protein